MRAFPPLAESSPADELARLSIAVVIPAFREGARIQRVIDAIPELVSHIIVVDDGSPDHDAVVLETPVSHRVRLVRHDFNRGVGSAMLSGYALAEQLGADIIVKMDGDEQMDPQHLERLVLPIARGEADYTKGNRFLHRTELQSMPFGRRLGNFALTFMAKVASGYWNIFDPTNGYTAIHTRALRLVNRDAIAKRYFFETSLLLELGRVGAVVRDVPMPARYGTESSTMSLTQVALTFPLRLIAAFFRRLARQYFLHDFNAVSVLITSGLPLLAFGIIWGALHWYVSISSGKVATTGTVLIAVLPIIIGVQFLVQALALDIATVPTDPVHTRFDAEHHVGLQPTPNEYRPG